MTTSGEVMELIAEADYIRSVDPTNPGTTFNHDPSCFARYCEMQAKQADRGNFVLIAAEMRKARDSAIESMP